MIRFSHSPIISVAQARRPRRTPCVVGVCHPWDRRLRHRGDRTAIARQALRGMPLAGPQDGRCEDRSEPARLATQLLADAA